MIAASLFGVKKIALKGGFFFYLDQTTAENGSVDICLILFSNFSEITASTISENKEIELTVRFERHPSGPVMHMNCYSHRGGIEFPKAFNPILLSEKFWLVFLNQPQVWDHQVFLYLYKTPMNNAVYVSTAEELFQIINREMQIIVPNLDISALQKAVDYLVESVAPPAQ